MSKSRMSDPGKRHALKKPKFLRALPTDKIVTDIGVFGMEEPLGQGAGDLTADSTIELPVFPKKRTSSTRGKHRRGAKA